MTLTASQWAAVKDGWGLEEVPPQFRRELCCCYCMASDSGRGKLYTDRGLGFRYSTTRELRQLLDDVRQHCYCRHHAECHFQLDG